MHIAALITFLISLSNVLAKLRYPTNDISYALSDHTIVSDSNVFPYVVAVLKKLSYMSAGALLNDKWVLTAADSLFLVRESTRLIRVRLGSINYKKGGVLLPVKTIEVHPDYVDSKPAYDVALMLLAKDVWVTPTLRPIRIPSQPQEITATHFIVTAWMPLLGINSEVDSQDYRSPPLFRVLDEKPTYDVALMLLANNVWVTPTLRLIRIQSQPQEITSIHFIVTAWMPLLKTSQKRRHLASIDTIKKHRMLSVSHLHPSDPNSCAAALAGMEVNDTQSVMCLDPDMKSDPCWRDTGAPVVLNGILWGVVSSWRPDDCYANPSASFVSLIAAPEIRSWVRDVTKEPGRNSAEERIRMMLLEFSDHDVSRS